MTTLYHIHVSCLHSDHFEEIFWQEGYWSLILTDCIKEVLDVMNEMDDKLRKNEGKSQFGKDFQAVIAIVKTNNCCDNHVTLQQLYHGYPDVHLSDLCFDNQDDEVDKYDIFHDSCYRDDTKVNDDADDTDTDEEVNDDK